MDNEWTRCPECKSYHTFPTPETAFERFCADCEFVWNAPFLNPEDD